MKDGCIFCKIANGEINSATIYEDELFIAIFDLSPASRGHILILTKDHAENLQELPDETASKIMVLAKRLAKKIELELACDGLNIIQNNGPAAGQTVFHYHMHLIPRYQNDQVGITWNPGKLTKEQEMELLEKLK